MEHLWSMYVGIAGDWGRNGVGWRELEEIVTGGDGFGVVRGEKIPLKW